MSGGASLPYALRHNKFVDRRIFVDLLHRISRWRSLRDHVYLSMGGSGLEDHKLIYSQLGLRRLISIDSSNHIVARQVFNKPIDDVRCIEITSSDMVGTFRAQLQHQGFNADAPVIVWFDYTRPSELGDQVGEFVQLLNTMASGDVVRITVNAHLPALKNGKDADMQGAQREELAEARLKELASRLQNWMPTATVDDMTPDRLPIIISEAFRRAALEAFPSTDQNYFQPLSAVRYADGQQMLSITGIVLRRDEEEEFWARSRLADWLYVCNDWTVVESLAIPELTLRERLFLDQAPLEQSVEDVRAGLGFDFGGSTSETEAVVMQYRRNGRYYPHFHYVPI